jgi:MFS family permease
MRIINTTIPRRPPRMMYLISFLSALYLALPLFIVSSFLLTHLSEEKVGVTFVATALAGIGLLSVAPFILRKLGNYRGLQLFMSLQLAGLLGAIMFRMPSLAIGALVLYLSSARMLPFHLDIFLEDASDDITTGDTRGTYLTTINFGILIAPLLAGFILTDGDYWKVFLLTIIVAVPILFLLHKQFGSFEDPEYDHTPFRVALLDLLGRKNILSISITSFLLYFFFSWMVIYTPIYLNQYIGFTWSSIGIIFTIMLLPYVLLELPLGRLADKRWGEKEMLSIGIIIMALSTALLSFVTGPTIWLWAAILFLTRVGASLVEIANETYFFKKVNSSDTHLISLFRMARPLGYAVGPAVATLLLLLADIRFLFLFLGVLILFGLRYSLRLEDTL